MEDKKMKKITQIGLFLFATYCILSRFMTFPDFLQGFITGLSIIFLLFSLLPEKVYNRIKGLKERIKNGNADNIDKKETN